ncbi:thiamine phosphate synthase [Acidocella sp.]|uniref:thiamine phosphate synthase n=1 Tax=Acidocella sp. TaxID=50710 RepID=UPI002609B175|nr:thiamine phosphate synthase [Acidocella sp.]MDD2794286.1 thiamine phosphate synthase [Acidocella sp.]
MDIRLIAWGRRVKRGGAPPPLWLFSDPARTPDLLAVVRALPPRLCGVVFRHDAAPERAALGAQLATLCRARRIALVVAGDARLAARLKAGVHLRGGRRAGVLLLPRHALVTASAHNLAQLRQAQKAGARIAFISPVFPTASHPGAPVLGGPGFRNLARRAGRANPFALGGINGASIRRLGKFCAGAGAIEALAAVAT